MNSVVLVSLAFDLEVDICSSVIVRIFLVGGFRSKCCGVFLSYAFSTFLNNTALLIG